MGYFIQDASPACRSNPSSAKASSGTKTNMATLRGLGCALVMLAVLCGCHSRRQSTSAYLSEVSITPQQSNPTYYELKARLSAKRDSGAGESSLWEHPVCVSARVGEGAVTNTIDLEKDGSRSCSSSLCVIRTNAQFSASYEFKVKWDGDEFLTTGRVVFGEIVEGAD